MIGTSLGPILEDFIVESKKSPVGVKPLTGSPVLGSMRDAVSYQDGICISLSSSFRNTSPSMSKDMLLSCFVDTAFHAMMLSPQAKKHAFAGISRNGDIIACGINRSPTSSAAEEAGYAWGSHHAEFDLFSQGVDLSDVSFFVGVRMNRFREFRCSIPCMECSKKYYNPRFPIYAIDWECNVVRYSSCGVHEKICNFPGASK